MSTQAKRTLRLSAAAITFCAILFVLSLITMSGGPIVPDAKAQPVLPSSEAIEEAMLRMTSFGQSPKAIAAGSGSNMDALAAGAMLGTNSEDLFALIVLETSRDEVANDLEEIEAAIWKGGASAERLTALQSAESELASRQAAVDQAEAALREDLCDHFVNALGTNNVALMDRFHTNRDRRVPDAMKALDLSDSQWRTLESACVKSARELTLTTEESTLLARCQSDQTTILIAGRLTANLASIETVFNNALAGALE